MVYGNKSKSKGNRGKRAKTNSNSRPRTMQNIARKEAMALKETKKQTIAVAASNITTTNSTAPAANWSIAQGDTSLTREGNEIYATSFYHKFIVHANTTGSNSSLIRLLLYIPRHCHEDVIENLTVLNSVDTDKFKVLYDRTLELGFGSGHATGAKVLTIKRKFKKSAKLYFTGNTAAPPISPVMKWVWVSDQLTTDKPPTLQAQLTNYFKD